MRKLFSVPLVMIAKEDSSMLLTTAKRRTVYNTWSAFKKDLELLMWCHLANDVWLRVKPRKPLPWHESDLKASLSVLLKI